MLLGRNSIQLSQNQPLLCESVGSRCRRRLQPARAASAAGQMPLRGTRRRKAGAYIALKLAIQFPDIDVVRYMLMSKMLPKILPVLIAGCFMNLTLLAQSSGTVTGRVFDQTGAVIPGVTVDLFS